MFTISDLEKLEQQLTAGGLKAGLAWLNARVSYRFTAVSRLYGQTLELVELIDKKNSVANGIWQSAPLKDSFCEFAIREGQFVTSDTIGDTRLDSNPYREILRCYVGLPVHRLPGDLLGTFCHFDLQPRDISVSEFSFLQDAVTFLSPYVSGVPVEDMFHPGSGNSGFAPL